MTTAIEREFNRLNNETNRIQTALYNLRIVEKWVEYIDNEILRVTGIYSSGYAQRVSITLDSVTISTFNDGTFAQELDDLRGRLHVEVENVRSDDSPELLLRTFTMKGPRAGIEMEYILRAYLKDDSTCRIVVDHEEEVTTEKWVTVTEKKQVLRIVCPEE
jgi:hypothetical protein